MEDQDEENSSTTSASSSLTVAYVWSGHSTLPDLICPSLPLGQSVTHVSLGHAHYALITSHGRLFTWGANDRGQLGLGVTSDIPLSAPTTPPTLAARFLTDVSCGRFHSVAVTRDGGMFSWGDGREDQCGVGRTDIFLTPQDITICDASPAPTLELPSGRPTRSIQVMQVACGWHHSAAITYTGELYTWGRGAALGLLETVEAPTPRRVEFLCGRHVLSVTCGARHTVVLLAQMKRKGSVSSMRSQCQGAATSISRQNNSHRYPAENPNLSRVRRVNSNKSLPENCIFFSEKFDAVCLSKTSQEFAHSVVNIATDASLRQPDKEAFAVPSGNLGSEQPGNAVESETSFVVGDIGGESSETEMLSPAVDAKESETSFVIGDGGTAGWYRSVDWSNHFRDHRNSRLTFQDKQTDGVSKDLTGLVDNDMSQLRRVDSLDKTNFTCHSGVGVDNNQTNQQSAVPQKKLELNLVNNHQTGNGIKDSEITEKNVSSLLSNSAVVAAADCVDAATATVLSSEGPKSRTSFLDETEATEFLEKQLRSETAVHNSTSMDHSPRHSDGMSSTATDLIKTSEVVSDTTPMMMTVRDSLARQFESSPLARTVESLLSRRESLDLGSLVKRDAGNTVDIRCAGPAATSSLKKGESLDQSSSSSSSFKRRSLITDSLLDSTTHPPPSSVPPPPITTSQPSHFARTVESLRQRVPSSPVLVQEYMTHLTKSVATSLRSSVDRLTGGRVAMGTVVGEMYDRVAPLATGGRAGGSVGGGRERRVEETGAEEDWLVCGVEPTSGSTDVDSEGDPNVSWTVPKSQSLGPFPPQTTSTHKLTHRRNASLPVGTLETSHATHSFPPLGLLCTAGAAGQGKIVLDTEVWSWGEGGRGQLGHGDTLDRSQPCRVDALSDSSIMKLCASDDVTLALCTASRVYAWGDNSRSQLALFWSSPTTVVSLPQPVQIPGALPCWDIAAGDGQSIMVCDGIGGREACVYIWGKSEREGDEEEGERAGQFTRFSVLKDLGLVFRVYGGGGNGGNIYGGGGEHGGNLACLVNPSPDITVYELAATQRQFHITLDRILHMFVKPLVDLERHGAVTPKVTPRGASAANPGLQYGAGGVSLSSVQSALSRLVRLMAVGHVESSCVVRGMMAVVQMSLVRESDAWLNAYQAYFNAYSELVACSAFEKCVKHNKDWFEKIAGEFASVLEDSKINTSDIAGTFQRLLYTPFQQPREYKRLLQQISTQHPAYTPTHLRLQKLVQACEALKQRANVEQRLAETTATFWRTSPPRLVDSLQSPSRRVLRDSRTHLLTLASAGRFTAPYSFVLFDEAFVYIQYSTYHLYPLELVWIEILVNTKYVKNAISLVTPEESFTLTAPSHADKVEWVWCINQAISRVVAARGGGVDGGGEGGRKVALTPPRDRHATHVFTKVGPLKDAKYTGLWRDGKIFTRGELQWADGRSYRGQFLDGLFDGYGVYTVRTGIPKGGGGGAGGFGSGTGIGEEGTVEISEGFWKAGQLHGPGIIRYSNGDVFKGQFSEGRRHGHGVLKQGKLITSQATTMYTGQWANNKKHGYGVCDYIYKGQKYMGLWAEDSCHGNGIIVTGDGLYFEGNFTYGKMTGQGLLITDDNSWYGGEFSGGPTLFGKGTLLLPNGDYIDGQFNGSLSDGVKVNGVFYKTSNSEGNDESHEVKDRLYRSLGKYSVPAARKWDDVFNQCYLSLGSTPPPPSTEALAGGGSVDGKCTVGGDGNSNPERAWERVATAMMSSENVFSRRGSSVVTEELQFIPHYYNSPLTFQIYQSLKTYLSKAFDTSSHPLGHLLEVLVDAYLSTYVGVGAHVRLLTHAVQEFKSLVNRIYPIVRLLFPSLPESHDQVTWYQLVRETNATAAGEGGVGKGEGGVGRGEGEVATGEGGVGKGEARVEKGEGAGRKVEGSREKGGDGVEVGRIVNGSEDRADLVDIIECISSAGLLYPILLPKIYPPLFNLYSLHDEKDDERYWKRIRLWNKQSSLALMTYLGVDRKFLSSYDETKTSMHDTATVETASSTTTAATTITMATTSSVVDLFDDAIDRLQRIRLSFSPAEKLSQIQLTFYDITTVVQRRIGCDYQWSMDDLFPVFQYVVVRSMIQHLGAEIHFIEDLMEQHLKNGELGIMFTTLKNKADRLEKYRNLNLFSLLNILTDSQRE